MTAALNRDSLLAQHTSPQAPPAPTTRKTLRASPAVEQMPGREAGKAKPLKAPKKGPKEYDEDDLEFLKKKKEDEKAMKEARDKIKGGKK
ncbi:MAG: hypothetical protein J3K34DRAFT_412526 [Monoraphidium minutum]|nr:MAG: hypothetical protein J3K34DRAFT_412526 [Monoraphidium minutum]